MMVCTVLIWFILTVLQESSNLDGTLPLGTRTVEIYGPLVLAPAEGLEGPQVTVLEAENILNNVFKKTFWGPFQNWRPDPINI